MQVNKYKIANTLEQFIWSEFTWKHYILLPFSWIYSLIVLLRRWLYLNNIFFSTEYPIPVIVVGNITIGGNGKTPFVEWLTKSLVTKGYRPCIIISGYAGNSDRYPFSVDSVISVQESGDEAKLLHNETGCPVVVDSNRVRGVKFAMNNFNCNIIISDDGLQHYALKRNIEICLYSSEKKYGNECCLPAGPLREPLNRLNSINFLVDYNNAVNNENYSFTLKPKKLVNIINTEQTIAFSKLKNKNLCIITSIARGDRIANIFNKYTSNIKHYEFPDHYQFSKNEMDNLSEYDYVIFTKKDLVKCEQQFIEHNFWVIDYQLSASKQLTIDLYQQVSRIK